MPVVHDSIEERILRLMRNTLVNVVKDTATPPGFRHPLKERTIEEIRHALELITARQKELAVQRGEHWEQRPRYPDQPAPEAQVVPLSRVRKKPGDPDRPD